MNKEEFKTTIKRLGLSQKAFAELAGYNEASISRWEDNIPLVVKQLLFYYEKAKKYDEALEKLGVNKQD
jgi:transcriptional regulator with XRE-family HTH domain